MIIIVFVSIENLSQNVILMYIKKEKKKKKKKKRKEKKKKINKPTPLYSEPLNLESTQQSDCLMHVITFKDIRMHFLTTFYTLPLQIV